MKVEVGGDYRNGGIRGRFLRVQCEVHRYKGARPMTDDVVFDPDTDAGAGSPYGQARPSIPGEHAADTSGAGAHGSISEGDGGRLPDGDAPSGAVAGGDEGGEEPVGEGVAGHRPAIEDSVEAAPGPDGDSGAALAAEPSSPAPPDADSDPEPESHDPVAALGTRLDSMVTEFSQRAQGYESVIRLLQAENEELRKDQVRVLLKPVFERLAALHAQAGSAADSCSDESAAADLRFFGESITDLLEQLDVVSLEAAVGDRMTPRVHHAVRTVATEYEEQDGTIHRVHRQGFAFAGSDRPLLPARVSVYRYRPPSQPPAES